MICGALLSGVGCLEQVFTTVHVPQPKHTARRATRGRGRPGAGVKSSCDQKVWGLETESRRLADVFFTTFTFTRLVRARCLSARWPPYSPSGPTPIRLAVQPHAAIPHSTLSRPACGLQATSAILSQSATDTPRPMPPTTLAATAITPHCLRPGRPMRKFARLQNSLVVRPSLSSRSTHPTAVRNMLNISWLPRSTLIEGVSWSINILDQWEGTSTCSPN